MGLSHSSQNARYLGQAGSKDAHGNGNDNQLCKVELADNKGYNSYAEHAHIGNASLLVAFNQELWTEVVGGHYEKASGCGRDVSVEQ